MGFAGGHVKLSKIKKGNKTVHRNINEDTFCFVFRSGSNRIRTSLRWGSNRAPSAITAMDLWQVRSSIYLSKEKGRGRKMVKAPRCDCTVANVPNAFYFFKSHFQNIRVAKEIRHFTNQKDLIPSRYASISSKKRNPFFNSDLTNMRLAREIPHFPRRNMCKSFELRSNSTNRFLTA